jgi:outer membrane protein assembly factor BamD
MREWGGGKQQVLIAIFGAALWAGPCLAAVPAQQGSQQQDGASQQQDNSQETHSSPITTASPQSTAPQQGTAKPSSSQAKKKTTKKSKNVKDAKKPADDATASAEPDKVLYDRAMADVKKGRYTEGRLSLQTLINTYPDSEYLAKAKLAEADSYYKEGGTTNLTQAIQGYKDFETFFPFLDEASYAQMQIGMAHYKMMEKSDRDTTQAQAAEDEFQAFLLKYPQSSLAKDAEQRLRDVQEVLADGEFKIAQFYYVKQDLRASAARLVELTDRYPLYSQSDEALWMLGDIFTRAKNLSKNEDDKNHWADLAGKCYDRIVADYPLSKYSTYAKSRLKSMGMQVPPADPNAFVRMKKEQEYARAHKPPVYKKLPASVLKSNPDISMAAQTGAPNLNPPTDVVSATEILKPGAPAPTFGAEAQTVNGGDESNSGETVVTEGSGAPAATGAPTTAAGAEIISTGQPVQPTAGQPAGSAAAGSNPAATAAPITNPSPSGSPTTNPSATTPAPSNPPAAANPPATGATAGTAAQPNGQSGAAGQGATGQSNQNGQASSSSKPNSDDSKPDPQDESTSKKKKGIKKIIPW